ncbi:NACHT domain-containing protein, partial [Acinetobacter sp. WCHAc060025]|uniref:NACHT domain-containing protein n=1 Tax=Acinetobacter sp. WCHAc060025 TaxID=2518625 RepID=UPI001022BE31
MIVKIKKKLIHILVDDPEAQLTLINSIENSTPEIQQLLTTPLMIGLYVKKFNADFSPPENITSFYRNIFEVVATTHDRTKGGFTRKSSSNLMQDKLEQIFERFCFECYKKDQTAFDKSQIIEILDLTLKKLNIDKCSSIQILDDFCDYLCLIAKDGLSYTFIHRSIFEYYVAFFFSKLNKENAERVIPKILNTNILNFLKHLNIYYFNLFYLKSELEFILNLFEIRHKKYDIKQVLPKQFLTMFFIGKQKVINDSKPVLIMKRENFDIIRNHSYLDNEFFSEIFSHISQSYSYTGIYIS